MLLTVAYEPGDLIEDVDGVAKQMVSLLTFSEGLGTIPETAMWELKSTFFSVLPGLSFLKPCLSLKKVGKHKGTDWTRFAALHPFPQCMDPIFMHCTVEVKLIVEKQKDPSLVLVSSDKFSEILVEGLKYQYASMFMEPGRYSAVIVISWCRRYFQISFVSSIKYLLLVPTPPPHLHKMRQGCCIVYLEMNSFYLKMLVTC